jgi:predicted acetyltransferase
MSIDIRPLGPDRHGEFIVPLLTAFGLPSVPERIAQAQRIPELDLRLAAFDGEALVGGAGSFAFTMTTPGGVTPVAGLTMVGVLPTHRRQGILTQLMRRHLDLSRERGEPVAALWASEGPIYGRYGYGLAAFACTLSIERDRSAFAGAIPVVGRARLVDEAEAMKIMPAIWDRVRRSAPGMPSRSEVWWEVRRLHDWEWARQGGGPLQRVVIEIEGLPQAYALYRVSFRFDPGGLPASSLNVLEAVGATPAATRRLWRYLFDMDLIQRIEAMNLPIDHPLLFLVAEPRRLRFTVTDGLYVRIVDVEAALAARAYGNGGALTLEIEDRFCPWNSGRFRLDGAARRARRTDAPADLRLDAAALGSVYLGAISFRQLEEAERVEELTEGAVEAADALFRWPRAPWCPEIF